MDKPIKTLLIYKAPPSVNDKDPMFCLHLNGEAIWEWRQVCEQPEDGICFAPTKYFIEFYH